MITRKMKGMKRYNYWERLQVMKMISTERRTERYKIIYMWKVINGKVPDLGFSFQSLEESRSGLTVKVPPKSGTKDLVQTLKDQFFTVHGPRLFNSMPACIRARGDSMELFKVKLDVFLMTVPDKPVLAGYNTPNTNTAGRQSNSIIDWVRTNPRLLEWEWEWEWNLDTPRDMLHTLRED